MGQGMGKPVPGQGAGQGQGNTPVPGTDGQGRGMVQKAGTGGLYAGRGSAPYGNTATNPLKATSTQVVAPKLGAEGPSETRQVDGSNHPEDAQRQARQLAVQFLKAEEEALHEEPLPLTRREEVLRYFTTLRRRIEDER